MQWATLRGMYESRATVTRAIERGWVILQARIAAQGAAGKSGERNAALTDEGRRLARRGR
jgi:hypothetical protein